MRDDRRDWWITLSFLSVPVLFLLMVAVHATIDPAIFFDPPWLILVANTLFITVISLVVAFFALKNFAATGRIQVLMLGCGVLVVGIASFLAALVRGLPDGPNLTVTIHNTGALLGGGFHFIAAFMLLSGFILEATLSRRRIWLLTGYGGCAAFMAVFTAACLGGMVPPFFIQGSGPTLLRQVVLGAADILFVFSAVIFMGTYLKNREPFLAWYAGALALMAIGLTAVFTQSSVGSAVGWVGRISQYLAGAFFLVSLVEAGRTPEKRRTSLDNVVTASLSGGEERFRSLAENVPDVIRRFDRDLHHLYVNDAGLKLYGKPAGSILGRSLQDAGLTGEQVSLWTERLLEVFRTGKRMEAEDYLPSGTGPAFYLSYLVPEFGPDGTVEDVLVVSRDLTERKHAEMEIRHLAGQRQLALDAARMGWWSYDPVTGRSTWDDRYREIFAVEEYELPNDQILATRLHPDDLPGVWAKVEAALDPANPQPYSAEYRIRIPDGSTRWIEAHGVAIFEGDGGSRRATCLVGTVADITGRKGLEEALKRKQTEVQTLIDNTPAGLVLFDAAPPYTVLAHNRYYQELFAEPYRSRGMAGLNVYQYAPAVDSEGIVAVFDEVVRTKQPKSFLNFPYRSNPPKESWFNWYMVPIILDGRVVALVSMSLDVTDRHLAEEALRESEERLRALYESMTEGFTTYDVVYEGGKAVDYLITGVNPAFERITGIPRSGAVGRRGSDLYGTGSPPYLDVYARVASGAGPEHFETYFPPTKQHFSVSAFSPGKGRFATVFTDITERMEAEAALRESEARFRALAEAMPQIVWSADASGVMDYYNARAYEYGGVGPEEAKGWNWESLIHPEDRRLTIGAWERALGTGVGSVIEHRLRRADGQYRWHLTRGVAVRDEGGTIVRWIGTSTDIHDLKETEKALRLYTDWLGIAQREANAGFWDMDLTTGVITWSPELFRLFGLDPSVEASLDTWARAMHEADRERALAGFNSSIRERRPLVNEFRVVRPGGREVWVGAWGNTSYDGAGRPLRNSGLCMDITDRKLAEEQIRSTSQYLENLINYANAPIIVWDPAFRITRFNHAFERLTGRVAEDVVGRGLDILFPPETVEESLEYIRRTMAGERWEAVEIPIAHRDGSIRTVLWNSATLYEADGKTVSSAIAQGQDITERKQAEEAVFSAKRASEEALEILRALYDNAPIGFAFLDTEFRYIHINGTLAEMNGIPVEDHIGRPIGEVIPEIWPGLEQTFHEVIATGRSAYNVELNGEMPSAPGVQKSWLANVYRVQAPEGLILGIGVTLVDVTGQKRMMEEIARKAAELAEANAVLSSEISHRKQAEEASRKTLSILNAALESTADAILVIDRSGRITSYNQNFMTMWNLPESVLHTLDPRISLDYLAVLMRDHDSFIARMQEIQNHPARESFDMLELLDGRIIERYSKPQKIGAHIVGRVFSFRDVTDRKHAELQLIRSLEEKEVLLREIHHRVKNNLQLTASLLDLTRMRTKDSITGSTLTDLMLKIQTMAQIHTRLYESKQFDRINMDAQVRDQVRSLSSIYGGGDQEIGIEISSREIFLPLDQAIPSALAINEILSNAYKHAFVGRKRGTVKYSAREEGGQVIFTVSDNGIGLPRGFDLSRANSLGLKLVRTLVEQQMKGTFRIRRKRAGTEVTVEIPQLKQDAGSGEPEYGAVFRGETGMEQ